MSDAVIAAASHADVMEERPFAIPSIKLVMWLFIISDAVTFGAMLFAYGYLRNATPDWPTPFKPASIINAMFMTFVLVTSSLTILLGARAAEAGSVVESERAQFYVPAYLDTTPTSAAGRTSRSLKCGRKSKILRASGLHRGGRRWSTFLAL